MFKKAIRLVFLIAFDVAALLSSTFLAYLIRKEILLYIHPVFRMPTVVSAVRCNRSWGFYLPQDILYCKIK